MGAGDGSFLEALREALRLDPDLGDAPGALGTLLLGMPLCWVIIYFGMESRSTVINSPLLAFEVTQTGFGMYVKYFMAGFLVVYALSMLIQFVSYCLSSAAILLGDSPPDAEGDKIPR